MSRSSKVSITPKEQSKFVNRVEGLFSPEQFKLSNEDREHWGQDWTRLFEVAPLAVVFPNCINQVVELVRLANAYDYKLVPSGGRTGLSGGCVASNGEVVVSFDRMNQILEFNPVDRLVHCQAGVVTAQLQQYAMEQGLFYPVDFASSGSSQIGGNIATNAGGIRVIRYGLTRDWVSGMTVVTGNGEVVSANKGLVKNATGYDLRHLFVGSEGTLGFVVEAQMKLCAPPELQRVMIACVSSLQDLLSILQCFQKTLELSAFEFFSDLAMSKVLGHRGIDRPLSTVSKYYALLEYDESMTEVATQAFSVCVNHGWITDGILSQSISQSKRLWEIRDGITESIARFTPYKNDISVRISEVPGFLDDVEGIVKDHYPDLEVCWFGHIGDGNLHLNILKPQNVGISEFEKRCRKINHLLFERIRRRGGSISAEHGVGLLKRDFLSYSRSQSEIETMRAIKEVFDRNGIMNPGKVF
ncbi:MAG: FAD-binding oxidoreductase [Gammaproteobacteria bacterium]|nr:FAD-binding oxidoreductase [Gammaproteobacteria bacterium]